MIPESGAPGQFYLHPHQETTYISPCTLIMARTFFLVNLGWNYPFHIVGLDTVADILRTSRPGTFPPLVSDPMALWC